MARTRSRFVYRADKVGDPARGRPGEDWQAEQSNLVLQIIGQNSGEIPSEEHDAPRVVEALGERDKAGCIETVLEPMQILEVLFEGVAHIGGHARARYLTRGLHGVERCGESDGEVMEMALKVAVALKTEAANDANDGGWVCLEALGHGADAQ